MVVAVDVVDITGVWYVHFQLELSAQSTLYVNSGDSVKVETVYYRFDFGARNVWSLSMRS